MPYQTWLMKEEQSDRWDKKRVTWLRLNQNKKLEKQCLAPEKFKQMNKKQYQTKIQN